MQIMISVLPNMLAFFSLFGQDICYRRKVVAIHAFRRQFLAFRVGDLDIGGLFVALASE